MAESTPRGQRRTLAIGAIAVLVALLIGGVAGAAMRHPATKVETRTHMVTVTSTVTVTTPAVVVVPQACLDLLRQYYAFVQTVQQQTERLQTAIIGDNGSDIATNSIAQLHDLNVAGQAEVAALPTTSSTACLHPS